MTNSDLPTLVDRLNWARELDSLSKQIQECPTPHVFGIHGDWGSGKTSFMRQLQWRLGAEMPEDGSLALPGKMRSFQEQKALRGKIATVWFDAWRYQNEPVPVVALLQEMRRQMSLVPAVMEKLKKLGAVAFKSISLQLERIGNAAKWIGMEGAVPSTEQIQKTGEQWEQHHHAGQLFSDSIRDHLQEAIKLLLPDIERARVVVFIDDLDRCNPKAAFRLLEGLKIYLSIPNCVFVLGMNERILVDAIREELSAPADTPEDELRLRAGHYLEKICTDLYRLPLPLNTAKLLTGCIEPGPDNQALMAAIGTTRCLPPNPRRLKALANQWSRFAQYTKAPAQQPEHRVWAVQNLVAAYIHLFHRDLWERWHFDPQFWNEIKAWLRGEREVRLDADDKPIGERPDWIGPLKLMNHVSTWDNQNQVVWKPSYPNPGDIEIFWIGSLIQEYQDQLLAEKFLPLLQR